MDEDECILSPNYPADYDNGEGCTILANTSSAAPIYVESFETEKGFDILFIDCVPYSGSKGPHGVVPQERIYWKSDSSIVGGGWKICPWYSAADNSSLADIIATDIAR
jgi:hypothetical protein